MAFNVETEAVVGATHPLEPLSRGEISRSTVRPEGSKPVHLPRKETYRLRLLAVYRDREKLSLRTRLLFTFGSVAGLHVAVFVLLLAGSAAAAQPLALGLVITAYLAGIKHSYDWDHLAAIDNSTRKFVAQHKDPVSVGFAFSLGHSSVVTLAGLLLVAGATSIGQFMEDGTAENKVRGLIGSAVSGLFLLRDGFIQWLSFPSRRGLAGLP